MANLSRIENILQKGKKTY